MPKPWRELSRFSTYACKIYHVGELGNGQLVKLLNNIRFATNVMNGAEMLRIAERIGLGSQSFATIVQSCSGASKGLSLFASMSSIDDLLSAVGNYVQKDVAAVFAAARDLGLDVSAFAATSRYFSTKREPAAAVAKTSGTI